MEGFYAYKATKYFFGKKTFAELVFNTAYIEGCNITFPQTQTIIDGAVVSGISVDDIQTVLNLRDGWKFVINSVDAALTLDYICKINEYVSRNESLEWGVLRKGTVGVGDFIPSIPIKENVLNEMDRINGINSSIEKALEYFAYILSNSYFGTGIKGLLQW